MHEDYFHLDVSILNGALYHATIYVTRVGAWKSRGRDARRIMRTVYILFSRSEVPVAKHGQEIMDLAEESTSITTGNC
jgi:hypothetical protein